MPEGYEIAEPYDGRIMQEKQAGYRPVSTVGNDVDPAVAAAEAGRPSLSEQFAAIDAERTEKSLREGGAAIRRINSYVANEESLRNERIAMQKQRIAMSWERVRMHQEEVAARANAFAAANTNPDQEAAYQSMAKELGVPVEQVRQNPNGFAQRLSQEQMANIVKANPSLARFMANPDNARVAHDDVKNLSAWETAFQTVVGMVRALPGHLVGSLISDPNAIVSEYGRMSSVTSQMEQLSMNPEAISGDEYHARLDAAEKEASDSAVVKFTDRGYKFGQDVQNYISGDYSHLPFASRFLISGAGSVGSMIPGIVLSGFAVPKVAASASMAARAAAIAKSGASIPGLAWGALNEYNSAFMGDLEEGHSLGSSAAHALFNGIVEWATEVIPFTAPLKRFGFGGGVVSGWLADRAAGLPLWKMVLKDWAREVPSELVATTFQDWGDIAAKHMGGDISGSFDSNEFGQMWDKYIDALPADLLGTLISVFPMSFGMGALGSLRKVRASTEMQKALKEIKEKGDGSKLRGRSKENFERFVKLQKEGTPVQDAFIDAEDFTTYFQEQNVDPKQAAEEYGIKNYDEAVASNGKVAMPFEKFAGSFAADGHVDALMTSVTLNENIPTIRESAVHVENVRKALQILDKQKAELEAAAEQDSAAKEAIDRIAAVYARNLQAIRPGDSVQTIESQARVAATFHVMPIIRDIEARARAEGREATREEKVKAVTDTLDKYDLRIDRITGKEARIRRNLSPGLDSVITKLRNNALPKPRDVYGPTLMQAVMERGGLLPTDDLKQRVKEGRLPKRLLRKGALGADVLASDSGLAGYMGNLNLEGMQADDALIEALEDEYARGTPTYDSGKVNEDLLGELMYLNHIGDDIAMAGIDLNDVTDNEEVRRKLAEFNPDRYGEQEGDAGDVGEEYDASYNQRGFTVSDNPTAEEIAEANRQYDEVVAKYRDTDQWMKAPNGEPTNLDERQWVQVRTPNFKQWFGDWESIATKKVIENLTPQKIVIKEGIETKKDLEGVFRNMGPLKNSMDSFYVEIPINTAGKIINHRGEIAMKDIAESFPSLFESAVMAYEEEEKRTEGHKFHPNVAWYRNYVNKFTSGDGDYYIRFTVRGLTDGRKHVHNASISSVSVYKENEVGNRNQTGYNPAEEARPHLDIRLNDWFNHVNTLETSKVVDANGEPMVVYHGTTKAGFDVFNTEGSGKTSGTGSFFAQTKDTAKTYSGTDENIQVTDGRISEGAYNYPVFLNISNPSYHYAEGRNWDRVEQVWVYSEDHGEMAFDSMDEAYDWINSLNEEEQERCSIMNDDGYGEQKTTDDLVREIRYDGDYDGVIIEDVVDNGKFGSETKGQPDTDYIVFNPNQVKSATANVGTFSPGRDSILYQQQAEANRLMAVHNLSGENLVFADEMGGLAVPSIGIVGQERGEVSGFGEITLIGTKSLGDPRQNPVFSSDAYTSTFPRPVYKKVPMAKRESLDGIFKETDKVFHERLVSRLDGCIDNNTPDRSRFESILNSSYTAKQAFLKSIGKEVKAVEVPYSHSLVPHDKLMEIKPFYEAVDWSVDMATAEASPEYKALADKFYEIRKEELKDLAKKMPKFAENMAKFEYKYGDQIADDLENYGKTEIDFQGTYGKIDEAIDKKYAAEFKSWADKLTNDIFGDPMLDKGGRLVPYTLDNIVDVMTSDDARNKEDTLTYSTGQARAAAAQRFRNLEAMREKSKETIVDDAQYREAREKTEELLDGYRKTISKYTKLRAYDGGLDIFGAMDASMRAVGRYLAGGEFTESAFKDALKREDFKARIPSAIIKQGMEAAEALAKTPVPYFESKPQRAVSLDEFAGAVIPKNTPQNVRDILAKHGIQTFEYDGDNRTEVTRQAAADLNSERMQTLFQDNRDKRGAFRVSSDRRFRIELFEKADFSTFVHESAHFQLEMLADMVSDPEASEYIKQEWQTICDYLGGDIRTLEGDARVEAHERFARSFEAYLMEGKSPSIELRTIFQRFKDWMVAIYKTLRNLNVKMGPEIREVFDRMMASDAQIKRAQMEQETIDTVATAEDLGMSEEDFNTLKKMRKAELAEADDRLRARMMRTVLRRRQKQYQEEYRKAEKQAGEEYEQWNLVYGARLLTGEDKTCALNEDELVRAYGKDYLKQLPKFEGKNIYAKEGESSITEIAETCGYESSEDFLQALENIPSKKEWVAQRAREIVDTYFGDIVNAAEVSDETNDAMNNDKKGERLRGELALLRKHQKVFEAGQKSGRKQEAAEQRAKYEAELEELRHKVKEERQQAKWDVAAERKVTEVEIGKLKAKGRYERNLAEEIRKDVNAQYEAMEQTAIETIKYKQVKDIKPTMYLNAMHKAMHAAMAALNKANPDYVKAARLKEQEMFNYHMYRAARDAQAEVKKGIKKMRDYARRSVKDLSAKRDIGMVYKAQYIAASLLGRDTGTLYDRIQTEVKHDTTDPFDYDIGTVREISYGEAMQAFSDAEEYWDSSLREGKIMSMGKLVDAEWAGGECAKELRAYMAQVPNAGRKHNRRDFKKDKFIKEVGSLRTSMIRMESWCDMIGGNRVGEAIAALLKFIFNPIKDAAQKARAETVEYRKELATILEGFKFKHQTVKVDALGGFVFGEDTGYAKQEIAHAFLHCGNRSNYERLIIGRGWGFYSVDADGKYTGEFDDSRWQAAVKELQDKGIWTKEDMDRVQAIWDLMDRLKPKLQQAHKMVTGRYFDEIRAEPIEMFGEVYKGGYVPAIYDPYLTNNEKLKKSQEVDPQAILNGSGQVKAKLSEGFGITRVKGVPGPLLLDISKIGQHFEQQVLFANMAPVAKDVAKVMESKVFQDALNEYDKDFYRDVILPWYSRAVTQNIYEGMPKRDAEEHWMNKVRSKAGIAAMFMNLINAVEGFFDLTAAYARVKAGHLHHAFGKMVKEPSKTAAWIAEVSPYMRERLGKEEEKVAGMYEQALHPSMLKKVDHLINSNAYWLQEKVDGFTSRVVFLGAYNQAREGDLSHEEAVAQAESVVRSVYGTMMPEDIASKEAGPVWKRIFTQFTGYFVQRANLIASERMKRKRDIENSARQKAAVAMLYLCTVFLPAWIGAALRKFAAGSDDENWTFKQWLYDVFGWGTMTYISGLANVSIRGQMATAMIEAAQGNRMASGRVFSSPATQMIGQVVSNAYFFAKDGEINWKKVSRLIAGGINISSSLPTVPNRPVATVKYLTDVARGEVRPTSAYDFVRGAVTGRASPDSK